MHHVAKLINLPSRCGSSFPPPRWFTREARGFHCAAIVLSSIKSTPTSGHQPKHILIDADYNDLNVTWVWQAHAHAYSHVERKTHFLLTQVTFKDYATPSFWVDTLFIIIIPSIFRHRSMSLVVARDSSQWINPLATIAYFKPFNLKNEWDNKLRIN